MDKTLSVSELATIAADPELNDDFDLILRQLRYWTSIGLIEPVGGTFTGKGKHRRYDAETAYRAALLVRFAALGLSTPALKALNECFDRISERGGIQIFEIEAKLTPAQKIKYRRQEWRWQVEHGLPSFLAFRFIQNPSGDAVEKTNFWFGVWNDQYKEVSGSEGLPSHFAAYGAPAIYINLTDLFRRVTARTSH